MSPPPALKAPPPPAPTWTGCYLDAGFGYGMWNVDQHTETLPGLVQTSFPTITDGGRGWLGRVGGGCDYQFPVSGFGDFVIGAFGDYDFMGLQGSNSFQNTGLGGVSGVPISANANESAAWSVGGRIGFLPYPNLMPFVSGGYTQTRFDQANFTASATGLAIGAFIPATTFNGWFIGGGYEYRVPWAWASGLYWRTEYRFAEYQAQDIPFLGPGATPGFGQHAFPNVQTVTTSLVWKFNWFGPSAHW